MEIVVPSTSLVSVGKILGGARGCGGRCAFNGSNKAEIECRPQAMAANLSALRGLWFARSPWSHRRLVFWSRIVSAWITGVDAYAASPCELDRIDKKICRYVRAFSKGKAYDPRCDGAPRTQLDKRPTPSQVEGVTSMSGDRSLTSQVVAGNDGTQPRTPADNGGNMETSPRRTTNVDTGRCLLKTCTCFSDCQAHKISSNCGSETIFRGVLFDDEDVIDSFQRTDFKLMRTVGRQRTIRPDLRELAKVHSAPNAQRGRQPRHQSTTVSRSNHESIC